MAKKATKSSKKPTTNQIYDSNPFTTAMAGMKNLFTYNLGSLVGVGFFSILIFILGAITVVAIALSAVGLVLQNYGQDAMVQQIITQSGLAKEIDQFKSYFSGQVAVFWITCGLIILVLLNTLTSALQIRLALSSAAQKRLQFGQLFRSALDRIWALIGLNLLVALAIVATIVAFAMLSVILGPLVFVLGFVVLLACFYFLFRFFFAPFAVIDGAGPVEGLRQSWRMTSGRTAEVVGITFAATTITVVPVSLLEALANNFGPLAMLAQIILMVVSLILGSVLMSGLAQRYQQFKSSTSMVGGTNMFNYLAPVIFLGAMILTSTVSPKMDYFKNYNDSNKFDGKDFKKQIEERIKSSEYNY